MGYYLLQQLLEEIERIEYSMAEEEILAYKLDAETTDKLEDKYKEANPILIYGQPSNLEDDELDVLVITEKGESGPFEERLGVEEGILVLTRYSLSGILNEAKVSGFNFPVFQLIKTYPSYIDLTDAISQKAQGALKEIAGSVIVSEEDLFSASADPDKAGRFKPDTAVVDRVIADLDTELTGGSL